MRRQVFTAAYSYELPFGRGKALMNNAGGFANAIARGWELAGITYLRSGTPFSLSITTAQIGWRATRPNANGSGVLSGIRPHYLPLVRSFRVFSADSIHLWKFGPQQLIWAGRHGVRRQPSKNFSIRERVKVQLRGEFFNFRITRISGTQQQTSRYLLPSGKSPAPKILAKCSLA
jgi:hypothetical protein